MKRILMMLAGYLVAVLIGLVAVAAIYAALSSLPNAPAYFDVMADVRRDYTDSYRFR